MKSLTPFALVLALACTPSNEKAPASTPSVTSSAQATSSPAASAAPPAPAETASAPSASAAPSATATSTAGFAVGEPYPGKKTCSQDAECVISVFPGCCACPQHGAGAPHALSKAGAAEEKDLCLRVRCDMTRCANASSASPSEPASFYVAKCTAGQCTRQKK